jgi:hypothetical protein
VVRSAASPEEYVSGPDPVLQNLYEYEWVRIPLNLAETKYA